MILKGLGTEKVVHMLFDYKLRYSNHFKSKQIAGAKLICQVSEWRVSGKFYKIKIDMMSTGII